MAAPDSTQLAENARCVFTCLPEGLQLPVLITLFAQIAGVNPDPTQLAENARCIATCVPPGMLLPILVTLAAQIASGGQLLQGNGAPGALVPADPTQMALYVDLQTGLMYTWNTTTQAWQ